MDNKETTTESKQKYNPWQLRPDEIVVSVLETRADGVRVKLWPDVDAVRERLESIEEGCYSVRHYVCGRAMYCAIGIPNPDVTRDAPCPAAYKVNPDANLNDAEGSLIAAAAEYDVGAGVFALSPLRIGSDRVQINPVAAPDGKTIHHYVMADRLTVDDILYNDDDGSVSAVALRKQDGSVIRWQLG